MRKLALRTALFLCALALPSAVAPLQSQQPRFITDTDLYKFVWIADPQMSPDGSQVAFVRVVVNEKTDDYDTNLMIVRADGSAAPRDLTTGTRDSVPRWSPDGTSIYFYSDRRGYEIWRINTDGGGLRQLTNYRGLACENGTVSVELPGPIAHSAAFL